MRLLGLLYRFTEIKDRHSWSVFYKTFISPKIEYCSPIWNMASISNLSHIDSVLNFFLSIVKRRIPSGRSLSKPELLSLLGLHVPSSRRKLADLMDLYNGNLRTGEFIPKFYFRVPLRITKNNNLLHCTTPRLSTLQRSLFHRLVIMDNILDSNIDIFGSENTFHRTLNTNIWVIPLLY